LVSIVIKFPGFAPIPAGTVVKMIVDNPRNPKKADRIEDIKQKIVYSVEPPPPEKAHIAIVPNFVQATVDSVTIHVNDNATELTVSNVTPV
jgi:hypothetical protein